MSRPWMPLYVADYLADTGHLSTLEHGAYMLLIMHYWQNGVLPDDDRRLARICRMAPDEWQESRDILAELFDDGWSHKRIDAELAKAADVSAKRRTAAQQRQSKSSSTAPANAEQVQPQSQSHTTPDGVVAREARDDTTDSDWILKRCLAAVGLPPTKALQDLTEIRHWMRAGWRLEEDIIPVLKAKCPKDRERVKTWRYFAGALRDAFDRPAATPARSAPPARPRSYLVENRGAEWFIEVGSPEYHAWAQHSPVGGVRERGGKSVIVRGSRHPPGHAPAEPLRAVSG